MVRSYASEPTLSSCCIAPAGSSSAAAFRFSRKCSTLDVPGISSTFGDRRSSHARATCSFDAPSASATADSLSDCSGESIESDGIRQDILGTWMASEESGLPAWRRGHFDRATDVGVPLVPHDSGKDVNKLLDEAASGSRGGVYRSLGRRLAECGTSTVYARLWWEFNLNPMPQTPDRFVKAWRRAAPLIREGFKTTAAPGQRLEVVWCANGSDPDPEPFYPGDSFVDVIGADIYGMVWGKVDPTAEQMLRRVGHGRYTLDWLATFEAHGKPTCLGEWGNVSPKGAAAGDELRGAGDCPAYIDAVYDWAARCKFGCRHVCYFNIEAGGVGLTLDDTPASLARLKARAGNP